MKGIIIPTVNTIVKTVLITVKQRNDHCMFIPVSLNLLFSVVLL